MGRIYTDDQLTALTAQVKATTLTLYDAAPTDTKERGMVWYETAHDQCITVASDLGVDPRHFVAAVAVLSPFVRWEHNIEYAAMAARGETPPVFGTNRRKAKAALEGDLSVVKGDKVEAFDDCLWQPTRSPLVVVDRHMVTAYKVRRADHAGVYEAISTGVVLASVKLRIRPNQAQAVVWETMRP